MNVVRYEAQEALDRLGRARGWERDRFGAWRAPGGWLVAVATRSGGYVATRGREAREFRTLLELDSWLRSVVAGV